MLVSSEQALFSLQRPLVRVSAWGPLLCFTPSLPHPVSSHLLSCTVSKAIRRPKKIKKNILLCTILIIRLMFSCIVS